MGFYFTDTCQKESVNIFFENCTSLSIPKSIGFW